MNENVEVRFSRLERAPAYKTVSDAILKDIIGGRLRIGWISLSWLAGCVWH